MRFRLRTDFLTFARDQIRGGLWYKPGWWEAVQRVPPTGFVPRIKKAEIPRIRFIEDRLIRDFDAKNPMVRTFDGSGEKRLASVFARYQVARMKEGKTEEEAYGLARAWLVENKGKEMFRRLALPQKLRHSIMGTEEPREVDVDAVRHVLEHQVNVVDRALGSARQDKYQDARTEGYVHFRTAEEVARLRTRAAAGEPAYGRPASPASAAPAAAAAPTKRAGGAVADAGAAATLAKAVGGR